MKISTLLTLYGFSLVQLLVAAVSLQDPWTQLHTWKRSINAQTQQELTSILSPNATIYDPSNSTWLSETERYMQNVKPDIELVVRPGVEEDVAKIVTYANAHNIEFYAANRGHSLTTDAAVFKGIQIDLRSLNRMTINPGNTTATIQGGVYGYDALNWFYSQGYVTATGTCSCVGLLGPALGGGHGLQQGRHGLTMDHFVSLNVVLANGTAVKVDNQTNTDLWWAMRGAGHNFGIVTSYETVIRSEKYQSYFYRSYQFASGALEAWIEQINEFQGNGTLDPVWLGSFGLYTMNYSISSTNATGVWIFVYDGPQEEAEAKLAPFDAIEHLSVDQGLAPYVKLNDVTGGGVDGSLCQPNYTHIVGTANLQVYNVTAMRQIYDLYNTKIAQEPGLGGTRVLVEGYAMQGVRSFAPDDSAYPQRAENILTYFDVKLNSTNDSRIGFAQRWRDETVDLWNAGQPTRPKSTYVNYAAGYESLEARYGFEPWRLERLRSLKKKYDPENRFAWYNPIIPPRTLAHNNSGADSDGRGTMGNDTVATSYVPSWE